MDLADLRDPDGYKPKPSQMDLGYLNALKAIYEYEGKTFRLRTGGSAKGGWNQDKWVRGRTDRLITYLRATG